MAIPKGKVGRNDHILGVDFTVIGDGVPLFQAPDRGIFVDGQVFGHGGEKLQWVKPGLMGKFYGPCRIDG